VDFWRKAGKNRRPLSSSIIVEPWDNDGIFRGTFDANMKSIGVEVKRTAIEAPKLNKSGQRLHFLKDG